ncbi:hypothetical protein BJX96DRAFT_177707 [Aspergillus floccosus]
MDVDGMVRGKPVSKKFLSIVAGRFGSSALGHMSISLVTKGGQNAFLRKPPDPRAPCPDVVHLCGQGRHFLAGNPHGLPDITPLFAPTVNFTSESWRTSGHQ